MVQASDEVIPKSGHSFVSSCKRMDQPVMKSCTFSVSKRAQAVRNNSWRNFGWRGQADGYIATELVEKSLEQGVAQTYAWAPRRVRAEGRSSSEGTHHDK